jgi:hypothetical protein
MSLYNMMNGYNEHAGLLCHILGLKVREDMEGTPVGRFRDISLNADGTEIYLLTRNGGGNRECWNNTEDSTSGNCLCPGCIQTQLLPQHENYINDRDDDFDCTFAITIFSVPKEYLELTKSLATGEEPMTLEQKTMASIERIKNMSSKELRADPGIGGLMNQLEEALQQSGAIAMLDADIQQ